SVPRLRAVDRAGARVAVVTAASTNADVYSSLRLMVFMMFPSRWVVWKRHTREAKSARCVRLRQRVETKPPHAATEPPGARRNRTPGSFVIRDAAAAASRQARRYNLRTLRPKAARTSRPHT